MLCLSVFWEPRITSVCEGHQKVPGHRRLLCDRPSPSVCLSPALTRGPWVYSLWPLSPPIPCAYVP